MTDKVKDKKDKAEKFLDKVGKSGEKEKLKDGSEEELRDSFLGIYGLSIDSLAKLGITVSNIE